MVPDRGGEIRSIRTVPDGIELLMHAPNGFRPPDGKPPYGSGDEPFLTDYGGGWQVIGPNLGEACEVDGVRYPLHGDLVGSWSVRRLEQRSSEAVIEMAIVSPSTGLEFTRRIELAAGSGRVGLTDTVANPGPGPASFCWGQHLVFGSPLVGAGSELEIGGTIETPPVPPDGSFRLDPGQSSAWPNARSARGESLDLSRVPALEPPSHDDSFIRDLANGRAVVRSPDVELEVTLEWSLADFPILAFWQPLGGAEDEPLQGIYGLGIEPWSTVSNLKQARDDGSVESLAPGETRSTELTLAVRQLATGVVSP